MWILVSAPKEDLGLTCLGCGLGILLAAVVDWWKVWTYRGTRVFLCPDGLVHLRGSKTTVVRWADVTELRITGFRGRNGGGEEMSPMQEALRRMPYVVLILFFVIWPFLVLLGLLWLRA